MAENNEGLDVGEENEPQKEIGEEDDVDIYGDLESTGKESASNCDVIERFNKRFTQERLIEEDFEVENNLEEEDDVGLYDDLNTFENQLVAEELQAKVESLEQKCSTLNKENSELKTEMEKVNKTNLMLRRNISSVFKTAKAELERKERQLKELQREHDALIFRRGAANAKVRSNNVASQDTAAVPGSQILKKDSTKGNIITIENETECIFQMGPVSVSFVTESADFQKQRLKRMEAVAREKESEKLAVKQNGKDKETTSKDSDQQKSNQSSEDGEIEDEDEPQSNTRKSSRESSRRNEASTSRRRSPSSSRSPVNAKRKRSPSANRHYMSKRPNDRGDQRRPRMLPSPGKPFQYWNNNSNFHSNSRSSRR